MKANSSFKKVWRIFRFKERFELKDSDRHCRKTALLFSKRFVSDAAGQEAMWYFQQFNMLCNGDGEQEAMYDGLYGRLINLASLHRKEMRGYLLDVEGNPLSINQISRLLNFKSQKMSLYIKNFQAVKLIELVNIPKFRFEKSDDEPADDSKDMPANEPAASSQSTRNQTAADPQSNRSEPATDPQPTRNEPANTIKNKFNIKDITNAVALANGKGKEENKRPLTKEKKKSKACALDKETKKIKPSPPTTQPIKPKEADPGGSVIKLTDPLGSVKYKQPKQIGLIASKILHRYNPEAKAFAGDIFEVLQLSCHPLSHQGKREAASFASLWQKACHSGLSPPQLDQLRERAIAEARRIIKYWHNRKGKPAAVFCDVFNKMLANEKSRISVKS